jgi:hypothetical protein
VERGKGIPKERPFQSFLTKKPIGKRIGERLEKGECAIEKLQERHRQM